MKDIYNRIIKETSLSIISHHIITNGYLIDDAIIDFFRNTNMKRIQITLDGKKDTHDKTRFIQKNNIGSFDRIITNIKKLSAELSTSIISVRVNIDKRNYEDFVDLYHFLHEVCDSNDNIHVYPALIKLFDKTKRTLSPICFSNEELFELYEFYKDKGCNVVYFPKIHKHTCSICNINTFTIGTKGEVYKCPEDANDSHGIIGNVNSKKTVNEQLFLRYVNNSSQFKRKECKNCLCFPICYGGCGKIYLKDKFSNGRINYCHPLKNLEILKKAFLSDVQKQNKDINPNLQFNIY